jgi:hypothetical protein
MKAWNYSSTVWNHYHRLNLYIHVILAAVFLHEDISAIMTSGLFCFDIYLNLQRLVVASNPNLLDILNQTPCHSFHLDIYLPFDSGVVTRCDCGLVSPSSTKMSRLMLVGQPTLNGLSRSKQIRKLIWPRLVLSLWEPRYSLSMHFESICLVFVG